MLRSLRPARRAAAKILILEPMCPGGWDDLAGEWGTYPDDKECLALCSLRFACPARNEAYYYDLDAAEIECAESMPAEVCAEMAGRIAATEPVVIGRLRDAAVGDECRAAFARDELSEDDDEAARRLYAGAARQIAMKLMKRPQSYLARRLKRLSDELWSRHRYDL